MNLDTAIDLVQENIRQVQTSGEVAQQGTVIEVVPHSKTGNQYARKRYGKHFEGCGRAGGIQHREAVQSVQRRKVIDELTAISNKLNELKGSQDWQAISSAVETIEMDSLVEALLVEEKPNHLSSPIQYVLKDAKGATTINRKVHAISSKEPDYGRWCSPALCGERPKAGSWGWRTCYASDLSCPRCYKKVKALT